MLPPHVPVLFMKRQFVISRYLSVTMAPFVLPTKFSNMESSMLMLAFAYIAGPFSAIELVNVELMMLVSQFE